MWSHTALNNKIIELEYEFISGDNFIYALTAGVNGVVRAWSHRNLTNPVVVPESTVCVLMNSTEFDRDLYFTLVDVVCVDPAVAARMCLNG